MKERVYHKESETTFTTIKDSVYKINAIQMFKQTDIPTITLGCDFSFSEEAASP